MNQKNEVGSNNNIIINTTPVWAEKSHRKKELPG
jgi:hypothetical protein